MMPEPPRDASVAQLLAWGRDRLAPPPPRDTGPANVPAAPAHAREGVPAGAAHARDREPAGAAHARDREPAGAAHARDREPAGAAHARGSNRAGVPAAAQAPHAVDARRESELLLGHALQRDRAWLFAHANDAVPADATARFAALAAQRRAGVPVAQLLGEWGFWTLALTVTRDTLIPRPETELLVEAALARLQGGERIADLGTGTGAIALALARERPQARIVATDASTAALDVARSNAARNEIGNVEFLHGDWYAALRGERFDLIASNPPYIADADPHLAQGDLRFEPRGALASGADGLDALRVIAAGAPAHLAPGGWLLLEHGHDQGDAVRALLRASGLRDVETLQDLEARDRVTLGRAP